MLDKLRPRSIYDVMAAVGCVAALATGTAYAANTVRSSDIVDNEVGSADVKDNSINTFDVHSFLGVDVIDGSLTGSDVGNESLSGADILDNSLGGEDVGFDSVDTDEVANGGLLDVDVGQAVARDFVGVIGVVPASSCVYRDVSGLTGAGGDHLLLTANTTDAAGGLIYGAEYNALGANSMRIKVCNPFAAPIDDGNTHFNLIAINSLEP